MKVKIEVETWLVVLPRLALSLWWPRGALPSRSHFAASSLPENVAPVESPPAAEGGDEHEADKFAELAGALTTVRASDKRGEDAEEEEASDQELHGFLFVDFALDHVEALVMFVFAGLHGVFLSF